MKEDNGNNKSPELARNRKLYFYVAISCAALLLVAAIVVTSVLLAGRGDSPVAGIDSTSASDSTDDSSSEKPVVNTEGFASPVAALNVVNEYGFYHNKTLNIYYEHMGVDFTADAGTEVYAAQAGTVESVYTSDVLVGTRIVIDHGDGLKTVYEYVEAREGLKAGDKVERGEVIAAVAEANGSEYKDGAHLHFEVIEKGENIDPAKYLTFEEK